MGRRLGEDARDVAHLAPGADLKLAIKMQSEIRLSEDVAPVLGILADQIVHFDPATTRRPAERPAGDGADMLFELRRLRAFEPSGNTRVMCPIFRPGRVSSLP